MIASPWDNVSSIEGPLSEDRRLAHDLVDEKMRVHTV
jgi:hypothetical protein